jgi:methyl-accepting chemotaxis protein
VNSQEDHSDTISQSTYLIGGKALRLANISEEINAISHSLQSCDTQGATSNISRLNDQVSQMRELLDNALSILAIVKNGSKAIGVIADQTNILSVNAAIQAAQSIGVSGMRFSVVAHEVKQLATRSKETSINISKQLEALIVSFNKLQLEIDESIEGAVSAREKVAGITKTNDDSSQRLDRVGQLLKEAFERENQQLKLLVKTGVETEHSPFCDKAMETATLIGETFEAAIKERKITSEALFSSEYTKVEGTNPEQFKTPYIDYTDKILPTIQEPVCQWNPKVAFCAAVRVDSFLPTHILKVSNPQRLYAKTAEDIAWNDANCRNHRFFKDPTGLAAGKNREPCMVRVYDRKVGDVTVIMYDVSSPIMVNGKHWGGVRIGYKAAE